MRPPEDNFRTTSRENELRRATSGKQLETAFWAKILMHIIWGRGGVGPNDVMPAWGSSGALWEPLVATGCL